MAVCTGHYSHNVHILTWYCQFIQLIVYRGLMICSLVVHYWIPTLLKQSEALLLMRSSSSHNTPKVVICHLSALEIVHHFYTVNILYTNAATFKDCFTTSAHLTSHCTLRLASKFHCIRNIIYRLPLGNIIWKHDIKFHRYANDTQLNLSFKPNETNWLSKFQACLQDIRMWMTSVFGCSIPIKLKLLSSDQHTWEINDWIT